MDSVDQLTDITLIKQQLHHLLEQETRINQQLLFPPSHEQDILHNLSTIQ